MDIIQEKWNDILNQMKTEFGITDVSFDTWIKPLTFHKFENDTVYVLLSNHTDPQEFEFATNYFEKRYKNNLMMVLADYTGKKIDIKFVTPGQEDSDSMSPVEEKLLQDSHLNPRYTFETFVVGGNNKFAQSAALAVAETPGEAFNPLYIYGGPGLGKTHLLHAIGNFILKETPSKKVLYVTSEEFLNEVIESLRSTNNATAMTQFRNKYRAVDVLMIDDIQFIIGKEATQDEFFHTFNTLHSSGKQIILTSDRPPKEMKTLEDRIRSRFEWGLMADIGYPDYETRMAIIRNKVANENINLSEEVLNYIGENIKSNVREIEGALNKLSALSRLENKEITLQIAIEELQNIISPDSPREITPQTIIEVVADHYQISMDQMTGKNRSSAIAKPRQIAMYLCKQMTDNPLDAIGALLGGRDHSTIIHGAKKIEDDIEKDPVLKQQIETIMKKINPN